MKRTLRSLIVALFCLAVLASALRADTPVTQPTRAAFLKLLDRPRVELAATQEQQGMEGDLARIRFTYASEAGQRVPGILLKGAGDARRPAVIVAHGTGGKKDGELALLKTLGGKGFVAVAIDARYHGERGASADYSGAIARAFEHPGGEHPLYYDTVWDLMRLVDYLQSRPDVDPKRIGLMGISKGGIETYFTAAADERIAVAVPCIGVQSFAWGLEHDAWPARVGTIQKGFSAAARSAGVEKPDAAFARRFYDRVVPGIYSEFDGPVMLTLCCPRPVLMINGDRDDKTPLDSVDLCAESARGAYRAAGVEERFKQIVERETGHAVNKEARGEAVDWLVRWLKP
jgi:dienelactone hydrolase